MQNYDIVWMKELSLATFQIIATHEAELSLILRSSVPLRLLPKLFTKAPRFDQCSGVINI